MVILSKHWAQLWRRRSRARGRRAGRLRHGDAGQLEREQGRQGHAHADVDHRCQGRVAGHDRRVQEGRPERHDQGHLRADGPVADGVAGATRRGQRARPVRRLAGQRLGDGSTAARSDRAVGGPLRPSVDQGGPQRPQAAARRQGQDLHVVARRDADRRHLQQAGVQAGGHLATCPPPGTTCWPTPGRSRPPGTCRSPWATRRRG